MLYTARSILTNLQTQDEGGGDGRELAVEVVAVIASPGNKAVVREIGKGLSDSNHFVRTAAGKVIILEGL